MPLISGLTKYALGRRQRTHTVWQRCVKALAMPFTSFLAWESPRKAMAQEKSDLESRHKAKVERLARLRESSRSWAEQREVIDRMLDMLKDAIEQTKREAIELERDIKKLG